MYILNPENLPNLTRISVPAGKYLERKLGVYAINKSDQDYSFANTDAFREAFKKIPFWIRK